jgi:hypothetical protein
MGGVDTGGTLVKLCLHTRSRGGEIWGVCIGASGCMRALSVAGRVRVATVGKDMQSRTVST